MWAFRQSVGVAEGGTSDSSMVVTPGAPTLSGSVLIAFVAHTSVVGTGQVSSVTDVGGNTWVELHEKLVNNKCVEVWATKASAVSGDISVNMLGTAGNKTVVILEFTGGSVDQDGQADDSNTTGDPSITWDVGDANDLSIAVVVQISTTVDIASEPSGWTGSTNKVHSTASLALHTAYQIGLAAGSQTYNPTTLLGPSWNAMVISLLKEVLGGMDVWLPVVGAG